MQDEVKQIETYVLHCYTLDYALKHKDDLNVSDFNFKSLLDSFKGADIELMLKQEEQELKEIEDQMEDNSIECT